MRNRNKRALIISLVILALAGASLACSLGASESVETEQPQAQPTAEEIKPEATSTLKPTPVPPTPTASALGMSRSNPYARSELISGPNWDFQVVEIMRGDEAWQALQAADSWNEPPPEGWEYLLLKIHAKCTYNDSDEHNISGGDFNVTGDRYIEYYTSFDAYPPDPELYADLYKDGETEGWAVYLIGEGEGNLILVFDEIMNYDEDRFRYIALDEGASLGIPPELKDIQPTDLGTDRNNPAPLGETVVSEDWQVTILEVIRGEEALAMIMEANEFNESPAEGMEYILARVHVRYISTIDGSMYIDSTDFQATGDKNVLYEVLFVVEPEPILDIPLFPSGEYEGWIVMQASQGETGLLAVYNPLLDFSGENQRYLALE